MKFSGLSVLLGSLSLLGTAVADVCPTVPSTNVTFGGFVYTYPWPIHFQQLTYQNQTLCQAYMDVKPNSTVANNETIVMFHGKNFCSVTWEATARVLLDQGYRVILTDHIGFCKSSKPESYQYSLQQMSLNVKTILDSLNLTSVTLMGHSLGGMLASRFTMTYPDYVDKVVLVDPMGLEDWLGKGVPYVALDTIYTTERASTFASIKGYEQVTYYGNTWNSTYDVWVNMLLQVYNGSLGKTYAYDQALITDMVLTQPIVYTLPKLASKKVLLIIGELDNTAVGKTWSPASVAAELGDYPVLGQEAAAAIGENCTLVEIPGVGHAPQIQVPETFYSIVLNWL